ncbi:MAG: GDSL-type esterase/lipase family protein [Pseudomonadales bacterium]
MVRFSSDDPTVWERDIRKFALRNQRESASTRPIVFTGSSSIRFWSSLKQDMAPLQVVNKGFGGSQIHHVTHYADRLVLPQNPRAIVFYAGENDIAGMFFGKKKSAAEVLQDFQIFCDKIHAQLADVAIHFIAIKPPKRRIKYWAEMQEANRLIKEFCDTDARLYFVDIVPAMLDDQGQPRFDVFKWDGIHMNEKGYAIWTSTLRPTLCELYENELLEVSDTNAVSG